MRLLDQRDHAMNEGHQRFQDWLTAGAEGDPPRDLAVHASVCAICQQSISALDHLSVVNTGLASMPGQPTGRERSRLVMAGRLAGATAVLFGAAILGVGVSQLIGVSRPGGPVAQATASPNTNQGVLGGTATPQPSPSAEPTPSVAQETLTPLGTPLPTHAPVVTPVPRRTPAPTPFSTPAGTPLPTPIATPTPIETPIPTPVPTPVLTPVPTPVPTAPSAPLSPIAVSPSSGSVQLSWQAPASDGGDPVIGYSVYRSTTSGAESFYVGGISGTSLNDSAAGGTVLYYVVTALNNFGESVWSAEASVTVAP
jgi:hypothetical protein